MSRARRRVNVEELLGRRVRTPDGRVAGRIEEIRAERRGDAYEVTEFLLGPGALVERLAIVARRRKARPLVVRWDQIDVSRPSRPVLTAAIEHLRGARGGGKVNNTNEND